MVARVVLALATVSLLALGNCARQRKPVLSAPEIPSAPRGFVGMTFLPAADELEADDPAEHRFVAPRPRTDLLPPEYPPAALAAGAPPTTIALRFTVDPVDGRVTKVGPSPKAIAGIGSFDGEFRAESERAVLRWRFTPGRIETLEDAPDWNGDGKSDDKRVAESVAVPVIYDVSFKFEILDGKPTVTTGER